jgi:Tol biopolymer transport system component/DNA-binding winged helix-turn-helix (wHTH) protein
MVYFGPFAFDTTACRLSRDGVEIHLTPKAAAVLCYLLRKPGELISKDEFLETVWEGVFVREESLTQAISVIRQTLGDSAQSPRYIETVSGEGYRFIGEVTSGRKKRTGIGAHRSQEEISSDAVIPRDTATRVVERDFRTRSRWWQAAGVGIALAIIALGAGQLGFSGDSRSADIERPADVPELVPLTFDGGVKHHPSLSPGGAFVAYDWAGPAGGDSDIWVKQIGVGTSALQITDDPARDLRPVWSPDGAHIAFLRVVDNRPAIYIVPALGGDERKLADVEGPYRLDQYAPFVTLSWSRQGHLAFGERPSRDRPARIMIIEDPLSESATKRVLTPPPATTGGEIAGDVEPSFSPDGKRVAFVRSSSFFGNRDIWVVGVAGGQPWRVTREGWLFCNSLTWTADGKELLFSAGTAQTERTYRVSVEGGKPRPVEGLGDNDIAPQVYGNRMVYLHRAVPEREIWTGPGRLAADPKMPPRRLIGDGWSHNGDFSPDGETIVMRSTRMGTSQIWIADRDGKNLTQLTDLEFNAVAPTWSPDGSQVTFFGGPEARHDVFIVNLATRRSRKLTTHPADDFAPTYSRDGEWIYFTSDRDGTNQIYKLPASGNAGDLDALPVTLGGGYVGTEHDDGFFYFVRALESTTVWRVPVGGGEETEVVDLPIIFGMGDVDVADGGLYYGSRFLRVEGREGALLEDTDAADGVPAAEMSYRISFWDFATERSTVLFEGPGWFTWLRVSPNEDAVLFSLDPGRMTSELVLVENFR